MYDGSMDEAFSQLPSYVKGDEIFVDARIIPTLHFGLLGVLQDGLERGFITHHDAQISAMLLDSLNTVYEALVLKHSAEMIPNTIPDNFENGDTGAY